MTAKVEVSLLKEQLNFMMVTIAQRWKISICLLLFQVQFKELLSQVKIVFQNCFINDLLNFCTDIVFDKFVVEFVGVNPVG